jgi:hypothetical protein
MRNLFVCILILATIGLSLLFYSGAVDQLLR